MCAFLVSEGGGIPRSVINAFATFLLLSYSKLLTVSYNLLDASTLHNNRSERVGQAVLFFDASVVYFSRHHLSICFACNVCPAGVCSFPTVNSPPVPHEIFPEMSWIL